MSGYLASEVKGSKIYCIGGFDNNSKEYKNVVEVYDVLSRTWETKAPMPTSRGDVSSVIIDDDIYVLGCGNAGGSGARLNKVEVYNISSNKWTTKSNFQVARSYATAKYVNNRLYLIGGLDSSSTIVADVEMYNPILDRWEFRAPFPTPRERLSSVIFEDRIYLIGGRVKSNYFSSIDVYNPESSKTDTSSIDVYIKPQNILSVSLNTNKIKFEDFNGVEDMVLDKATIIVVESNLRYQIKASLESDIRNNDGTEIIDKNILQIKSAIDDEYKTFPIIGEQIDIFKNLNPDNRKIEHDVSFKLKAGIPYKVENYKTSIKFEVAQI